MSQQPRPESPQAEAQRWEAALFGDAPPPLRPKPSVCQPSRGKLGPTVEYLDSLLDSLLAANCDIKVTGPGRLAITGDIPERKGAPAKLPRQTLQSFQRVREDLIGRLLARFDPPQEIRDLLSKPKPSQIIQWVDSEGKARTCLSAELAACEWYQWRYDWSQVWHSPTGEVWRE